MKQIAYAFTAFILCLMLASCFSSKKMMSDGGEVTGQRGVRSEEPAPYGMVKIPRGYLKVGLAEQDSLWGNVIPQKDISVDGFWMDQTEVTNSMYRQFVYWVRDSIIRERLADPSYGGDETYKIEEDKYGDPVTPHLNWKKPIPWRKPSEDEERAIESVYTYHPIDGSRMLDTKQLNYRYEIFDYAKAAMRKYRLNPEERSLDTDNPADLNEVVMISKDTAYVDDNGNIVRQTITRPLSSMYDFLNTYIVNVYPDTTCWVNDFQNANNEVYLKTYFSSPSYNDYPRCGRNMGTSQRFLCLAHRISAERSRTGSEKHTTIPPAVRNRMGIRRKRQGRQSVPMERQRHEKRQGMFLCQLQTRQRKLHRRRKPHNIESGYLRSKLERSV